MPSLGADMDAGTLVEWLKKPGDALKRGDIVAVVETQKGAIEIEVFEAGVLDRIVANLGDEVPVGHVLAVIRTAGEEAVTVAEPDMRSSVATAQASTTPARLERAIPISGPAPEARAKVTPVARRLAAERGIDLTAIAPGPMGVIGLDEIESAPAVRPAARTARIDQAEVRKAIASAMARANREIPQYYVSLTIDVTPMMTWLGERNASRPVEQRVLYAVPLLRAVALAFRRFPHLNGSFVDGHFVAADQINVGVAIAMRGGGLISPAILETDTHDLDTLMWKLADLVKRVRSGGLRSSELSMSTVTLTNLGERTADAILPIIYPPQVAIVGCGQVRPRPWVVGGAVVQRQLLDVTLAGDHRASDGRTGAQYLAQLESLLSQPEAL